MHLRNTELLKPLPNRVGIFVRKVKRFQTDPDCRKLFFFCGHQRWGCCLWHPVSQTGPMTAFFPDLGLANGEPGRSFTERICMQQASEIYLHETCLQKGLREQLLCLVHMRHNQVMRVGSIWAFGTRAPTGNQVSGIPLYRLVHLFLTWREVSQQESSIQTSRFVILLYTGGN